MQGAVHDRQPLLAGEAPPPGDNPFFYSGPRRRQDSGWTWAFVLTTLATIGCGVALLFTGAPNFIKLISDEHLSDPHSCPAHGQPGRRLQEQGDDHMSLAALSKHPLGALSGTLIGSVLLGCLFVHGFKRHAHGMIHLALVLQVTIPTAIAVACFVSGQVVGGSIALLVAGLYIWLFWAWRQQIVLVGRLLGISGHALIDNPGLILMAIVLPILWGAILIPAGLFLYGAISNGHVVPNPSRSGDPVPDPDTGKMHCLDEDGNPVRCCSWRITTPAGLYMGLLGVALTWTSMLLSQIKLFTVAGTVAQWYSQPPQPSGSAGGGAVVKTGRRQPSRVLTSLGHALGPSFGSLCCAAALLTVIQYMRQALSAAEQQMQNENKLVALLFSIVAFILRIILAFFEFLTRFTTVRMAMTGENFENAAHGAVNLLKRNAMDAFGVWWLPPFILQNCALMVCVAFGFALWGAGALLLRTHDAHDVSAIVLGVAGGVIALLVISFFCGLLLDVIEGVFVCFAIDRDMARMTREDVFVVLQEVPTVKPAVVEQPGGDLAYGQPTNV